MKRFLTLLVFLLPSGAFCFWGTGGAWDTQQSTASIPLPVATVSGGTGQDFSSVPATRIPYFTGAGAMGTSANLTFDGTTLTIPGTTSVATITVSTLLRIPSAAAIRGTIVPSAAWQQIGNTNVPGEVCVSTGTNTTTWVKLAAPTVACSN